jgi:Holliday junction DNA helicase RuvB
VRDFAEVKAAGRIDEAVARAALDLLEVDPQGFDALGPQAALDHHREIRWRPGGYRKPVRRRGRERGTLEDVIEPFPHPAGFSDAHFARSQWPRAPPISTSA